MSGGCPFHALWRGEKGAIQLFSRKSKEMVNVAEAVKASPQLKGFYDELLRGGEAGLVKFTSITADDLAQLVAMREIVVPRIHEIVAAFYEKLGENQQLLDIINRHSTVERLQKTLTQYLVDMFSGEIGEEYVVRRKVIGNVHNRINLFPEWYLGAYSLIQTKVQEIVCEAVSDTAKVKQMMQSFTKLCSFDMQIAIATYIDAYTSSMMKLNEIEELQHQLNDSAATLAASAEETTSSIADKEQHVDEMLSNITAIQQSSQQMVQAVRDGQQEVTASIEKVDRVVELIEGTQTLTVELSQSSQQIGDVVQAIRTISNQTNILSLNAAIEAARAGEHGKGFSIVAQEVRNLATQTERALDQIQSQIKSVQSTVQTFEQSFQYIVEQTGMFRETNTNIANVLHQSVHQVEANSHRLAGFSVQVTDFKATFNEISKASMQIAEMAEQLSYLNNELSDKFRA